MDGSPIRGHSSAQERRRFRTHSQGSAPCQVHWSPEPSFLWFRRRQAGGEVWFEAPAASGGRGGSLTAPAVHAVLRRCEGSGEASVLALLPVFRPGSGSGPRSLLERRCVSHIFLLLRPYVPPFSGARAPAEPLPSRSRRRLLPPPRLGGLAPGDRQRLPSPNGPGDPWTDPGSGGIVLDKEPRRFRTLSQGSAPSQVHRSPKPLLLCSLARNGDASGRDRSALGSGFVLVIGLRPSRRRLDLSRAGFHQG